jgi:hypothetical protein
VAFHVARRFITRGAAVLHDLLPIIDEILSENCAGKEKQEADRVHMASNLTEKGYVKGK